MKYKINYGSRVAVIPEDAITAIARAGANDLRVLIALCAASGAADIKKLSKMGMYGAIVGKAIYTGNIDLKEAIEAAR